MNSLTMPALPAHAGKIVDYQVKAKDICAAVVKKDPDAGFEYLSMIEDCAEEAAAAIHE